MKYLLKVAATLLALLCHCVRTRAMDEGPHQVDSVGVYVYKSIARFNDHIRRNLELINGAHYYVQTEYSSDYWNLIGSIELPSDNELELKDRIACVSLAVLTEIGAVDIGVENAGNGWFPFYYSGYVNEGSGQQTVYRTARKVGFSIDAKIEGDDDKVIGYFTFFDSSGRRLGMEMLTFDKPRGKFYKVDSKGHPMLRFIRFMSLLPGNGANLAGTDVADFSYMRNVKFTGLQLYDRGQRNLRAAGYRVWNMSRIAHAWSVQTANIQNLQISPNNAGTDEVSIFHSYLYEYTYNSVKVEVTTDSWPSETSFKILTETGFTIYEEDDFSASNTRKTFTYSLGGADQFQLQLDDSYGDGFDGQIKIYGASPDGFLGSLLFRYLGDEDDDRFFRKTFAFSTTA